MINKNLPTKLFLNGPELSFTTQPGDVTTSSGIVTFTAEAAAAFPAGSTAVSDGSITFDWYYDGSKITDDADGNIETVGAATTLTLTGLTAADTLKEVYAIADYNPTAYSHPTGSDVTAGTARSTGNAFNEPVQSNTAIITVEPKITIDTQPTDSVVAAGLDHTYTIAASVAPTGPTLSYQWQLDGVDLVDGVITSTVLTGASGIMTIVDDTDSTSTSVDFGEVSVYNSFTPGRTYTVTTSSDIVTSLEMKGGGGGGSGFRNVTGSKGGKATGKFTFLKGQTYKIQVGAKGEDGADLPDGFTTGSGGFPGGGDAPSDGQNFHRSGAGGGYTGLFITSVTQANSILIAGGGGGSSGDPATGGDGGGEEGNDGSNGGRAGKGGTQSAGGAAGTSGGAGEDGSALKGGKGTTGNRGAAGGGGGYFGGGGGASAGPGTGGGGSGFKHGTLITDGVLTTGGGENTEGDGSLSITLISTEGSSTTTTSTTVTGATTTTLTINSDTSAISGVVKCIVSAISSDGTHASNSPLSSNEVNYSNLIPRDILNFEAYDDTSLATLSAHTMYEESDSKDITLSTTQISQPTTTTKSFSSNDIAFYAPEKDVYVEMEIRAGKGSDSGSNSGGKGGYSKIRFTANKNDEYIIKGLESSSAIFLYRQSSLIAVVGEGGTAARFSDGGSGGGIGQAGETHTTMPSTGPIAAGGLGENGRWGGRANPPEVYPEDDQFPGTASGRTIKCSKGVYWRDQGVSACADINGLTQFRLSDGTLVTNSGKINRGFKAGYSINSTGGAGNADGSGRGGHGATGGRGDTGGNGGAGGSGYTDGSLTYVVEAKVGENNGNASVILRLATTATDPVPVPPPPEERIVRWSVSRNAGDSNTVTFSKQSGIGPGSITFGPNSSNIDTLIGAGAVYTRTGSTNSGPGSLGFRLSGNTLGLDDRQGAGADNDYNDLQVTPNQGRFTSDSRWEANW